MLRSIWIVLVVSIMLVSTMAPASAESRSLYLPALGRTPTEYGALHAHVTCRSIRNPVNLWLTLSGGYFGIISYDGTVNLSAPVGTHSAIYFDGTPVTKPLNVQRGWQDIGKIVLPC